MASTGRDATPRPEGGVGQIHLNTVERALERAQAYIASSKASDGDSEIARTEALRAVRNALAHHVPGVRRRL